MILANCGHCGAIFPSSVFQPPEGASMRLSLGGNLESCPSCGRLASTLDGQFQITDGIVEIVSAPDITVAAYRRLREAIAIHQKNEITDAELETLATEIDPRFGKAISAARKANLKQVLVVLAAIIAVKCSAEVKFDVNRGIDQIWGRPSIQEPLSHHPLDRDPREQEPSHAHPASDGAGAEAGNAERSNLLRRHTDLLNSTARFSTSMSLTVEPSPRIPVPTPRPKEPR